MRTNMVFYNFRDPGVFYLDDPLCVALISHSKVEVSVSQG